jgi:hypothetical protein
MNEARDGRMATLRMRKREELNAAEGIIIGLLLSIPFWLFVAVYFIFLAKA